MQTRRNGAQKRATQKRANTKMHQTKTYQRKTYQTKTQILFITPLSMITHHIPPITTIISERKWLILSEPQSLQHGRLPRNAVARFPGVRGQGKG